MKIELHENTAPEDALYDAKCISTYLRFLHSETNGNYSCSPNEDDNHGLITIMRLQEALIDTAMKKQDAINAAKLKAVNA